MNEICECCTEKPGRFRCSWCRIAYYCSVRCQRRHWRIHQDRCATLSIKVNLLSGESTEIRIHPLCTVSQLKEAIFAWLQNKNQSSAPLMTDFQIELMCGERLIDDDMRTIQQAGLCAAREVQVVIRTLNPDPSESSDSDPAPALVASSDSEQLTPSSPGTTSDWGDIPRPLWGSPHTSDFEPDWESSDSAPEVD